MKNIFKSKITFGVSLALFLINFILLFGYSVIGFGTWRYSFAFFEVSQAFHQTYAPIATVIHLILALAGLITSIILLVYYLKK